MLDELTRHYTQTTAVLQTSERCIGLHCL